MTPAFLLPCLVFCTPAPQPSASVPSWSELRETVLQLKQPEGATELFKRHPRLAAAYAEPTSLGDQMQKWRDRLIPLPADPETVDPAVITVQVRDLQDSAVVIVTFHNPATKGSLTFLKLTWEAKSLVKVECFHGFRREIPARESGPEDYYRRPRSFSR